MKKMEIQKAISKDLDKNFICLELKGIKHTVKGIPN